MIAITTSSSINVKPRRGHLSGKFVLFEAFMTVGWIEFLVAPNLKRPITSASPLFAFFAMLGFENHRPPIRRPFNTRPKITGIKPTKTVRLAAHYCPGTTDEKLPDCGLETVCNLQIAKCEPRKGVRSSKKK